MAGSFPGSNSTSTTGPMTWTILPWLMCGSLELRFDGLAEGFGPADDIQELLRDALLAGFVVLGGQEIDHLARVLGRGFHGGHAGAVLAGRRLHEGAVHLGRDVTRQQRGKNGLGARLLKVFLLRPIVGVVFLGT